MELQVHACLVTPSRSRFPISATARNPTNLGLRSPAIAPAFAGTRRVLTLCDTGTLAGRQPRPRSIGKSLAYGSRLKNCLVHCDNVLGWNVSQDIVHLREDEATAGAEKSHLFMNVPAYLIRRAIG